MRTKNLTAILFLLLSVLTFANDKSSQLTGTVQDAGNHGLPFVTIEIYSKGEVQDLISGGMTDDKGNFMVEDVPYGEYEMVIMAIGFADKVLDIKVTEAKTNLGIIKLGDEVVQLEGAEIRAEVSTYRTEIDKRVVDVGKDLVSAGADAASVLNNIPSISVDQESGQVSLRGNENVKVMVDGKPSNIPAAQLLKQLPSNAIAKVEIITNPSAKYEPEGNSGILNIITHKNKRKGYNVGLNLGMTYGEHLRNNASVNANINTGNFNFFGNVNSNFGKNRFKGLISDHETLLDNSIDLHDLNNSQLYKVGFDWFMGEKSALTVYTSQWFNKGDGESAAHVFDNSTHTQYLNFGTNYGEVSNQDYSVNFKQDFAKEDHNIVLDAIYSKSRNDDQRNYNNSFPDFNAPHIYTETRDGGNENIRVNLDYTNQIVDGGKIESGLQFRQENSDNAMKSTQVFYAVDSTTFTPHVQYDFTRKIYSAYVNYGQKFGKFGMQLGLRAEQVTEDSDYDVVPSGAGKFENDYVEFYPSAFFTYDVTEKGQLSLNYSRRVDRPGVYQLTPVPEWSTTTLQSFGNPKLKPQFTNSGELSYLQRFKGGSINATVFYRRVNDVIFRYIEKDANDPRILNQMYINYDDSESYGVELSGNYKPTKWWSVNASFDMYQNQFFLGDDEVKAMPWSTRVNNNLTLTNNLSLQHFFMYRGAYKFIQGEMQPMWRMDLGARYSFMDGKATFTARVSDIFKTFYGHAKISHPTPGDGEFRWEAQTLYVGFTYNFGGDVRKRNLQQESNGGAQSGGGIGF
jgi:iron complex outermembrane receptor protein